jgi:5S rRNA maturation endonuclease (ribonuclease M5)
MQHEETFLSEQHRSFLNKRGITDKVITAFSISTADVPELRLQNAIVIPVRHIDGTHSFNKYRRDPMEGNVKPKYLFERGGKVTLYGADRLVADYPHIESETLARAGGFSLETPEVRHNVIITEGELDTLVCWSQNIPAVSSTAGASSFQEEWVQLLKCYEVYVCFDNDEAGHKGAIKVLDYLPEAKVIFVPNNIPGVKDISDYVSHGGDLHGLMQTAVRLSSDEEIEAERKRLSNLWLDYSFYVLLQEHRKVLTLPTNVNGAAKPTSHSDDRLERAKSVDCTTLIEFVRKGRYPVAKCRWHDDHDPSLTYYARNNTTYCHVCGKYADAIDILMARDGVDFKTALKRLLNE